MSAFTLSRSQPIVPRRIPAYPLSARTIRAHFELPAGPLRIVAVTGPTSWSDYEAIRRAMASWPKDIIVVQSGREGAEAIAAHVAAELHLRCVTVPVLWTVYGDAAPHLWAQRLLDLDVSAAAICAPTPAIEPAALLVYKTMKAAGRPVAAIHPLPCSHCGKLSCSCFTDPLARNRRTIPPVQALCPACYEDPCMCRIPKWDFHTRQYVKTAPDQTPWYDQGE